MMGHAPRTHGAVWLAGGGVAIAALLIYWPSRAAGFVGDDFMILHRLRGLAGLADIPGFFRSEFFGYYRPLGFASHALDWFSAGASPERFHLTNIALHALSAVLVVLIGHALSPRSLAGPLAGLLFALHAANHEAVVWISARFDLLATSWSLLAVCWMIRRWPGERWVPGLLFFPALLSKESAVAMPIVAAAHSVFLLRDSWRATALRAAPWLTALAAYSLLRHVAGGVSAMGGASRIPKLLAFGIAMGILLLLSGERWLRLRDWLAERRVAAGLTIALGLSIVGGAAAWSPGAAGGLARAKLSVAAFALFYSATPILDGGRFVFSDPTTNAYWIAGAAGLAVVLVLLMTTWRAALFDARMWFLAAFIFATLLPISALTEGKRYLYLPSVPVSLLVGVVASELAWRSRAMAIAALALALGVSAAEVQATVRDWVWAGRMTADGAGLVDASLAPSCGDGRVLFLTSPVAVRGIYTHFLYETFELPRGCTPGVFNVLARVVREDVAADVRWEDAKRIVVLTIAPYRGNLVLSKDLRHFDTPLRAGDSLAFDTPAGHLEARAANGTARLTLTLADDGDAAPHIYYYDRGRIRPVTAAR